MVKPDTIVAISTAPGRAAIGMIRLSGPESWNIVLKHVNIHPKSRVASHASFTIGKETLDDIVVIFYKAPHTYTGEDMVEISFHGNSLILSKAVRAMIDSGARLAEHGEFTKRAFLNGKMDLTMAEAVEKIVDSTSEVGIKIARKTMDGAFSKFVKALREELLNLSASIEVRIDYPDEFEDDFNLDLSPMTKRLKQLISTYDPAKTAIEGVKVALLGAPNVGKSSILNALIGRDRAIVTPVAGTTRDTVEVDTFIGGLRVKLIDTAGIRETPDKIEKIGVDRALKAAQEADIKVHIMDATVSEKNNTELSADIRVVNKIDLAKRRFDGVLNVSAKTGHGIEKLRDEIVKLATSVTESMNSVDAVVIAERQYDLLKRALNEIEEAEVAQKSRYPIDVVDINIRKAIEFLDSLTGRRYSDDILDIIFSNFCVGK